MNIDLGGNTLINGYFAGIVVSPGAGNQWVVASSAYAAVAGSKIQADTSGASFTITLPATASSGDKIFIQDATFFWNTNNLTIAGNGLLINGQSSPYTASIQGNKLSVVYISTSYGWSIK